MKELPQQFNESTITATIYKKVKRTGYSNYRRISLLPNTCKILFNIPQSRLTPYVDGITGDRQGGFQQNISNTDQIFRIRQILGKKKECNGTVPHLFIYVEKGSGRSQ
jgi:hypothetical protein